MKIKFLGITVLVLVLIHITVSCKGKMDFEGVVIDDTARFESPRGSGYEYQKSDENTVSDNPLIPFKVIGIDIPEELFIELRDDAPWWTLEICRIDQGWFNLDADQTGLQVLGIDDDINDNMLSAFPIKGYRSRLQVKKTEWKTGRFKYNISYKSPNGEVIEIDFKQKTKFRELPKKNGSTMGHSEERFWALVEVRETALGSVNININSKKHRPDYLVPLIVPKAFLIKQTITGIVSGEWKRADINNQLKQENSGDDLKSFSLLSVPDGKVIYSFYQNSDKLELYSIKKVDKSSNELFRLLFYPCLPDLRQLTSKTKFPSGEFIAGINGTLGYSYGKISIDKSDNNIKIKLIPEAPYWASDRVITTIISQKKINTRICVLDF